MQVADVMATVPADTVTLKPDNETACSMTLTGSQFSRLCSEWGFKTSVEFFRGKAIRNADNNATLIYGKGTCKED